MNKKAAIGLSINTLVVIIISLIILAGGVTLLYKFIGGAEQLKTDLDTKTEAELEKLLVDQGKRVALPLQVASVSRGEGHVFGLGILNIGGVGNSFRIIVDLSAALDELENEFTAPEANSWSFYDDNAIIIPESGHEKKGIMVTVPKDAKKGKYIFNAKIILENGEQYGNTQKFYVNVK